MILLKPVSISQNEKKNLVPLAITKLSSVGAFKMVNNVSNAKIADNFFAG